MIVSYRDRRTRAFAEGAGSRDFEACRLQAERRLAVLEPATSLDDPRALPSNRLEALRGDRKGHWSIRVNLQWHLCFSWPAGSPGPVDVELVDDH